MLPSSSKTRTALVRRGQEPGDHVMHAEVYSGWLPGHLVKDWRIIEEGPGGRNRPSAHRLVRG